MSELTIPQPGLDTTSKPAYADHSTERKLDWRVLLGLSLTAGYMLLMGMYITHRVGWQSFAVAPLDLMGTFLEGAFAPLAFLWLVIGYFLQQKELAQNTKALYLQSVETRKTAEQAVIQSRTLAASELHHRKQSFLQVFQSVSGQLGAISGFLFLSSQGSSGAGSVPAERMVELWHTLGRDDKEVFSRELMVLRARHVGGIYNFKLFFGTAIRTRHSDNFELTFRRLLDEAQKCDPSGMIPDSLLGSAHGFVYQAIQQQRANVPPGYTIGVYDFNPDSIDD